MRLFPRLFSAVVLGAMSVGFAAPAMAVAITSTSSPLTVGGLTYTVASCTYSIVGAGSVGSGASGSQTSTACVSGLGLTMVANGANTGVVFGATGNWATATGAVQKPDVALQVTVTGTGSLAIYGVTGSETGTSTGNGKYSTSVTVVNGATTLATLNLDSSIPSTSGAAFFTPVSGQTLTLNIDSAANSLSGGTAALTSFSIVANAPEPASMTILGVAFAGLAALRRRRTA